MAKLYAEMSSHGNKRKLKRADDICITVDLHFKNHHVYTVGIYYINETDGYRIVFQDPERGYSHENELKVLSIPK